MIFYLRLHCCSPSQYSQIFQNVQYVKNEQEAQVGWHSLQVRLTRAASSFQLQTLFFHKGRKDLFDTLLKDSFILSLFKQRVKTTFPLPLLIYFVIFPSAQESENLLKVALVQPHRKLHFRPERKKQVHFTVKYVLYIEAYTLYIHILRYVSILYSVCTNINVIHIHNTCLI